MAVPSTHALWSVELGDIQGSRIRMHISLVLLMAWVVFENSERLPLLQQALLLGAMFCSFLLHELAHAVVARHFRMRTREVVLSSFGGTALRIGRASPKAQIAVAFAGPLCNALIAFLLYPLTDISPDTLERPQQLSIVSQLFLINLGLVLLNLLPCSPMDGGSVVKILALQAGRSGLLAWTVRLGIGVGVVGMFFSVLTLNPVLFLICADIARCAFHEQLSEQLQRAASKYKVSEVMLPRASLQTFTYAATVSSALPLALRSFQDHFPVLRGNADDAEVMGLLSRSALIEAAATSGEESYLSGLVEREIERVSPEEPLAKVIDRMTQSSREAALVMQADTLVGLLYLPKVCERLLVEDLRQRSLRAAESVDDDF
jgi:Zn-dependent protease